MGEEHVSVPATYTRKKENEYTRGVITMTERNFSFTPNDSRFLSTHKIHVDIGYITVQYGSAKGTKAGKIMMGITVNDSTNKEKYIFELDNSIDGDSCRAHTNKYVRKEPQAKYVGKEPQGTTVSLVEFERRMLLLHKNLEHPRLFEQLVIVGKILNQDEFWAKRKKLLQAADCEPTNQQTGLKSAMTSYVQTKTVQMNSEIVQQVFTEKPVVLREFLKKVPDKINLSDFWSKFFTAMSYRQKEKISLGRAEASADRQLAIFLEDDDIVADEIQRKIGNVDPTVDIVADCSDDYTHLEGHGIIVRDEDSVAVVTDKLETALLHDINRHAIVVLEGRVIDSKLHDIMEIAKALDKVQKAKKKSKTMDERVRIQKVNKMVEIDDLLTPRNSDIPLHVKEDKTVDTGVENMDIDLDLENVYADLKERSLNITKKGLNNPIIKSDLTLKHSVIILELLWHFWASYPPTNELLDTKVNKLKESITERYNKLQEIINSLQSDVGRQLSLLLQPMLQAIGVANT